MISHAPQGYTFFWGISPGLLHHLNSFFCGRDLFVNPPSTIQLTPNCPPRSSPTLALLPRWSPWYQLWGIPRRVDIQTVKARHQNKKPSPALQRESNKTGTAVVARDERWTVCHLTLGDQGAAEGCCPIQGLIGPTTPRPMVSWIIWGLIPPRPLWISVAASAIIITTDPPAGRPSTRSSSNKNYGVSISSARPTAAEVLDPPPLPRAEVADRWAR